MRRGKKKGSITHFIYPCNLPCKSNGLLFPKKSGENSVLMDVILFRFFYSQKIGLYKFFLGIKKFVSQIFSFQIKVTNHHWVKKVDYFWSLICSQTMWGTNQRYYLKATDFSIVFSLLFLFFLMKLSNKLSLCVSKPCLKSRTRNQRLLTPNLSCVLHERID